MSDLLEMDLTTEEYREYDIPGRSEPYRINAPKKLLFRRGGTTHRIVDTDNVAHCVPSPGQAGCVLRWKTKDASAPVNF